MEHRESELILEQFETLPAPPVSQSINGGGVDSPRCQSEQPVPSVWDLGPK